MNGIKKFFTNKNTVTIVGIIAGILVLVGFYSWRVKNAISPIEVPYAKRELTSATKITKEDIGYMKVSSETLKKANVYRKNQISLLTNKYVAYGTTIPQGGMFYLSECVDKEELPDYIFSTIEAGYRIFTLKVDRTLQSYSNAIKTGDIIEIRMQYNADNQLNNVPLVKNIKVLAVRDARSNDIADEDTKTNTSLLLFAVDDEMFGYLTSAKDISGVKLYPDLVGYNRETTPNETVLVEEAKSYIKALAEFEE